MRLISTALVLACVAASPAQAFCIYAGKMDAKTTIAREFADSRFVVRARLMAADYHWSDEDESWTLYRVKVIETFKGRPSRRLSVFTTRDSGGFYLETDKGPDLSNDYLLFLSPGPGVIKAARGALFVNYNCGQSKPWREVTKRVLTELREARGSKREHPP